MVGRCMGFQFQDESSPLKGSNQFGTLQSNFNYSVPRNTVLRHAQVKSRRFALNRKIAMGSLFWLRLTIITQTDRLAKFLSDDRYDAVELTL